MKNKRNELEQKGLKCCCDLKFPTKTPCVYSRGNISFGYTNITCSEFITVDHLYAGESDPNGASLNARTQQEEKLFIVRKNKSDTLTNGKG